jgi:transposase
MFGYQLKNLYFFSSFVLFRQEFFPYDASTSLLISPTSSRDMLKEAERMQIVTLRSTGMKWTDIVSEMSRNYSVTVSVSGCEKIVRKWKELGIVADMARSGRPKLLDERDSRTIRRKALQQRDLTYRQLAAEPTASGKQPSKWTVMRMLRRYGLRRRVAIRRPLLTANMRRSRLQWARERVNWSLYRWQQVVFSDEKIFRFDSNKLRTYVTRSDSEKYSPQCIRTTVKYGIEVHVWAAFPGTDRVQLR